MNDIQQRVKDARSLWSQGDAAFKQGNLEDAYRLYTEAHDLITDCPELHRQAHQKLREVNRVNGNRGEYLTDQFLLWTAPFGMFQLLALFFRSRVIGSELCKPAR
jgi:hypothetical protein